MIFKQGLEIVSNKKEKQKEDASHFLRIVIHMNSTHKSTEILS